MTVAHLLDRQTHGRIGLAAQNAGRGVISKNGLGCRDASEASIWKLMLFAEAVQLLGIADQKNMQIGDLPETAGYRRDNATGTEVPAHHINRQAD
jgi:hypothetical protein